MDDREPVAGKHGFAGSYEPGRSQYRHATFSVGVFEWLPKTSGRGLKKGKVKVRIKGHTTNPKVVYDEARRCRDILDAGEDPGFKTTMVR